MTTTRATLPVARTIEDHTLLIRLWVYQRGAGAVSMLRMLAGDAERIASMDQRIPDKFAQATRAARRYRLAAWALTRLQQVAL